MCCIDPLSRVQTSYSTLMWAAGGGEMVIVKFLVEETTTFHSISALRHRNITTFLLRLMHSKQVLLHGRNDFCGVLL